MFSFPAQKKYCCQSNNTAFSSADLTQKTISSFLLGTWCK